MSSTEEPVAKPEETPAADPVPATEPSAATAILSPDPDVVEANLAKAEPVTTEAAPAEEAAPESSAPADSAKAEDAPAKPEQKSTLLGFLKFLPNPKTVDKSVKARPSNEAAVAEAAPAEPAEEKPFEGDNVEFKAHGGFFGGWKRRVLNFGKGDGYGVVSLSAYIAAHKVGSIAYSQERTNAAWDNAAHATVTCEGLLFIVKSRAIDVPLNIINLADVSSVTTNGQYFTVKTETLGDYEFNAGDATRATKWKTEIEKRCEPAKAARSGIQEQDKYKESLTYFKDTHKSHPAKTPEAVTSDEEGAISAGEEKKTKWSRRFSQRFTGSSSKDQTGETKKDASPAPAEVAAAATEAAAPAETAPAAAEPESVPVEAPAEVTETPAPESKKEKRKSLTAFGLFAKSKVAKDASPEPAKETTGETAPADTSATEATTSASETAPATEEAAPASPESKPEKSKRASVFDVLRGKKGDKSSSATPITNGEPAAESSASAPETTEEVAGEAAEDTQAAASETKPAETSRKGSLGRRLTSGFKNLTRSKSPEKKETSKVPSEAPKIETPIVSTSEPAKPEEPLSTTEAPTTTVDVPTSTEPTPAVVSTLA